MKDTFFTSETAPAMGRRGGLRSGEVRRARALRRDMATGILADIVYREYLRDVTEDELRDFIRWRGQRKRKATLAKRVLNEDDPEVHEFALVLVRNGRFLPRINVRSIRGLLFGYGFVTFEQALALVRDYDDLMSLFRECIDYLMDALIRADIERAAALEIH